MGTAIGLRDKYGTIEEDHEGACEMAWDDVSGATLNPQDVRTARQEEIDYVRTMDLYEKVPIQQWYERTGKAPISTRWIDISKGDADCPNYKSKLVAKDINTHKRDDLFATTPPLETLKLIPSMTATAKHGEIIMVNDISRAFFHARAEKEVYVQLPNEDVKPGEENICGRLNYSMYGTRGATQNWYQEYSEQLIRIRFKQGKTSPCVLQPGKSHQNVCPRKWLRECWDARGTEVDKKQAGKKTYCKDSHLRPGQRQSRANPNPK